jgi:hypothetical protein
MILGRRNRPRGCARRPALGVTQAMIKDNSNKRRLAAQHVTVAPRRRT